MDAYNKSTRFIENFWIKFEGQAGGKCWKSQN